MKTIELTFSDLPILSEAHESPWWNPDDTDEWTAGEWLEETVDEGDSESGPWLMTRRVWVGSSWAVWGDQPWTDPTLPGTGECARAELAELAERARILAGL